MGGFALTAHLFGRSGQLLLKSLDLDLDRRGFGIEALNGGSLGLIHQLGELQFDSQSVIFKTGVVHVESLPETNSLVHAVCKSLARGSQ